ncbi:hypothetical protein [Marivirga arenosa]|uniref:VLRF1 domain-containing protein n=1 Tax=Marivirga arenosa TaxID=3059076 RepID=A0AA52EZZ3_9BACT|nr:hypothetical protein [Marivirga sp. BKB1-2]WNB18831.1 hypothetical protein QYS47_31510 [Marivirga sp. BKB1-2]
MQELSTSYFLDENQLETLIKRIVENYNIESFLKNKNLIQLANTDIKIRFPFSFNIDNNVLKESTFIIILVHAGEASLAVSESDQIIEHKSFKAYMVRQKQGKSQIKHLKTKGKSKAGSRVRLASTDHFFNEINDKLNEWLEYYNIDRIALSCNKTLFPFLFNRENAAIEKEDERIYKIPKHIPEANFDNLLQIHKYLISVEIFYESTYNKEVTDLLMNIDDE